MLVQLGVLKGGHRVLFAVQPGTVLHGPGTCTPGPIDCEVLSLGQDQIESIARNTTNGLGPVSMFAVTGITASHYRSASAADKARNKVSAVGRRLLAALELERALPVPLQAGPRRDRRPARPDHRR